MKRYLTAVTISLAAFASVAQAAPIAYTNAPLSNVIAQLSQKYGIHIVLEGNLTRQSARRISFSVDNTGTSPTRLEVINSLANAAGVTFQKGFVVRKMSSGALPPPVPIDSRGYIYFKHITVPVRDAIETVASTDGATVDIASDVTGDVTLSSTRLGAADAAQEISRKTHTVWSAYYALMPRDMASHGKVVGHNSVGQPIVQLPFTFFNPPETAKSKKVATAQTGTPKITTPPAVATSQAPNSGVNIAPSPYQYVPSMGYQQMPYTYGNGYGYSPYGGGPYPYQYGGFGGYPGGGGVAVTPGSGGYGPFGGYGSPVTF